MKTIFTAINDYPEQANTKITVETDEVTLPEIVAVFEDFLKGAGYFLPESAHLDFVYDEDKITH